MAIAYESIATGTGSGNSITITKPSGLASGDLMVAHVVSDFASGGVTWAQPTGWTRLYTSAPDDKFFLSVLWKVADSSDAAASNFTFTNNTDLTPDNGGALYRFSGAAGLASYDQADTVNSNFTSPGTSGLTPTYANSFMLILVSSEQNGSSGWGSYAIATNNPTWTERHDFLISGTLRMAGATASRPEVTATGTASAVAANTGSGSSDVNIAIVAIYPPLNASASPSTITLTSAIPTPSVAYGGSAAPSSITVTSAVPAPTLTTTNNPWTNTDKTALPSWTNTDKT